MKIRTQLTLGVLGIAILAIANLGISFDKSAENDFKVVNQSGVVRGGTQRAIKLELSNSPNEQLIGKLNNLIDGLLSGSEELGLPQATDPKYIARMQEAQAQWELSQKLIQQVRAKPTEANRAELLKESEKLFELTNAAVGAAEEYSAADVRQCRRRSRGIFGSRC